MRIGLRVPCSDQLSYRPEGSSLPRPVTRGSHPRLPTAPARVTHHELVRTALARTWVRAGILLLVLLAGVVLALTVDLPRVGSVRAWLHSVGTAGSVALTAAVGVALLAPVPRTALSVLVGLVAGFWTGLAVALGGAMLGGLAGFGLSRWLGRGAATRLAGARLARVHQPVCERGLLFVLTARVIPVVAFTLLSYAAGLAGVRLLPYLAATAVGLVPSTVVQVGVGASAPFVVEQATTFTLLPVLLVAVLLAVLGALTWRRRKQRTEKANGVRAMAGHAAPTSTDRLLGRES